MGSTLIDLITAESIERRDQSLFEACDALSVEQLLRECDALEAFWKRTDNLYERVRALFFLYAIHRFILPERVGEARTGRIPHAAHTRMLNRHFAEAIQALLDADKDPRSNDTLCSGLASAYHHLGLQFLADQVKRCVRSLPGNRWMFRAGHPDDLPLQVRPELLAADPQHGFPVLVERTPVRMDLSHSSWSDIFFLGMDRPEFAKVINVSIDLALHGGPEAPKPPVEAWFRVIDEPVIRLVSVDLATQAEIDNLPELFDFGRDYLGLLKAAVIASGIIPPGLEGSGSTLTAVLDAVVGKGRGFELVSNVNNIPKGSRLAVSTNLLAALIAACMRATRQIPALEGALQEWERRTVAARAILGEWLGGSGGGWQDSGGVWPGIKLIEGCLAEPGDGEYGVSRGRLLPRHTLLGPDNISHEARERLQQSLILVHGGLAQNVGPILEMVTERYLLRSADEWQARAESLRFTHEILEALRAGDIRKLGELTTGHFFGPLTRIIPWATNAFTEALIARVRAELGERFWGFWMLGGMSGGGMGFIVDPSVNSEAKQKIAVILADCKRRYAHALPFAMDPVVYDFAINENGSFATFNPGAYPNDYYKLRLPFLLRRRPSDLRLNERQDITQIGRIVRHTPDAVGDSARASALAILLNLLPESGAGGGDERASGGAGGGAGDGAGAREDALDRLLKDNGFDPVQHEQIRRSLLSGRIGLAQNRLHPRTRIEDAADSDLQRPCGDAELTRVGAAAIARGEVAVVSLAAGAGSRWTQGAGVVKALHPFAKFDGRHRNFMEVHLAKTRFTAHAYDGSIPHVFTTSYLTHEPIAQWLDERGGGDDEAVLPVRLSRGQSVGLRLVPTLRDLRFAWEELPQEQLDVQAQKMRESVRGALKRWAAGAGEASDYRDNLPLQCMHPVGHWYEIPNLLLNGTLHEMLTRQPSLKYLMVHNIDTLGATVDPELLGMHIHSERALNFEVITRRFHDVGGGVARVDGRLRLIEGLALPREEDEFRLRFYNTNTNWITIDRLLDAFGLSRAELGDAARVRERVREFAANLPTYLTLKEVKKRWGRGQEDVFPVLQFERLWGDMSAVDATPTGFFAVSRMRGQQLKDPAQLDEWIRDGSHAHVAQLCRFE